MQLNLANSHLFIMASSEDSTKYTLPSLGKRNRDWTLHEHALMFKFLQKRRDSLLDHFAHNLEFSQRNKRNFFNDMACFIGTKNDKQCKSRYQKRELEFLKALKFPQSILDSLACHWALGKRPRKLRATSEPQTDAGSVEEQPAKTKPPVQSVQSDNLTQEHQALDELFAAPQSKPVVAEPIRNYDDLRRVIYTSFITRIENENIRAQMEKFLQKLPASDEFVEDVSSLHAYSINGVMPAAESFRGALQMTLSFMSD